MNVLSMLSFLITAACVWVVVWSFRPMCRACRGKVKRGARICPHCRSDIGAMGGLEKSALETVLVPLGVLLFMTFASLWAASIISLGIENRNIVGVLLGILFLVLPWGPVFLFVKARKRRAAAAQPPPVPATPLQQDPDGQNAPSPVVNADARTVWYIYLDGERGPFDPLKVKALADSGMIVPDTPVRKGENGKWVAAIKVNGLFPKSLSQ